MGAVGKGTKEKEEREPFRKERDPWRDYGLTGSCLCNAFQMGSYFGYAVAATDINGDG